MTTIRDESGVEIHPTRLPSNVPDEQLHIKPGVDGRVATDPARAGWRYLSFRSFSLAEGEVFVLDSAGQEAALVTISGGGVEVALYGGSKEGSSLSLPGRPSVFEGMPWSAYLPAGTTGRIIGRPLPGQRAVVALAQAPLTGRAGIATEPIVVGPADVAIEIRGAGNCTRQVNNIMMPGFPADRLLICEVFTPSGNWSGWPPHKHDVDDPPREAVLEETYFYQFRRPEAWAFQRIYLRDGSRDRIIPVHHGDVVAVDEGYHPFTATPGYDAYFLNALAGDRRTMANSEDPDLAWVKTLWPGWGPDPRLPLVTP